MPTTPQSSDKYSVYGGYGFVLGEYIRQFPETAIRIPKHDVVPLTPKILYGISTLHNYNVFDSATLDIETNLLHLMDTLDACQKTFGTKFEFNFISSWFVYGKTTVSEDVPFSESTYCSPSGFYSITKRCAEQLLISYCETFGIKYRILRLANVLGRRDNKVSDKKNALQNFIDKIVHNEAIELYDGGRSFRDYIDVRDCAQGIKLCLDAPANQIFNISNGRSYMIRDMLQEAIDYAKSSSTIWENQHPPEFHKIVQTKNVWLSNTKLKELGYVPKYSINNTIHDIVDYLKEV